MDKFWERYIQSRPADSKGAFDAFAAAHKEPRIMAQNGLLVGTPTKEVTQHGRRIYETPEGNVSEKSTTFFLNGKWLNVPSIHGGRSFNDDQLRRMIKEGTIQPTSVHGSRIEAEEAAASRSNMMKSHTKGFAEGQLVTPSVDGSRPGYKGEQLNYLDNPEFKKFYEKFKKEKPKGKLSHAIDSFERLKLRKNKIVGLPELFEALHSGNIVSREVVSNIPVYELSKANNPYSFRTLSRAFSDNKLKITKDMTKRQVSLINNGKKLTKIIIDVLGEPTTLSGGKSGQPVWDLNPSKIKKLNKELTKYYSKVGDLREATVNNIFNFSDNNKLMKAIDNYKGGKLKSGDPLLEMLVKEFKGGKDPSYTLAQLARALQGKIQIEGIDKNLKRGNRIVKLLGNNYKGPLGNGFLHWAKLEMGKHFDDPNATYKSLTNTIKNSMKEAGITGDLAIDEIFPARTGQLTLGKGSGAYNQIVQLIDGEINSKAKVNFDGKASIRYQNIIKNIKDKNWDEVNRLVKEHDTSIKNFYETNPQAKGKVKLTQLIYDPVKKRFASPTEIYGKDVFPSKIQKDMDKFYRKTGLSLDVGSTMTLEKVAKDPKTLHKFLKQSDFKIDKCLSSGGRVKLFKGGGVNPVNTCIRGVIEEEQKAAKGGSKIAKAKFGKFASKAGWMFGWADVPIELAFALPHMLQGDKEAAKRATTFGLFGWGEEKLDEIKADSPEAYKYAKHIKDNNDWIDSWFTAQDKIEALKTLKEGTGAQELALNQLNKANDKMAKIQEEYVGYVDEEGKFDPLVGAKGKTALQDYLREDVKKKADEGLSIDFTMPDALPGGFKFNYAPYKGGDPITNVKQYIEQKGEPYWKSGLEHATEEAGVPDLYDTFMQGADIKDPRDLYSELPLEYASELAALEKQEMLEQLKRKGLYGTVGFKKMLEEQGINFAGGGMVGIRKPSAIAPTGGPMSQGLRSLYNNGRKR